MSGSWTYFTYFPTIEGESIESIVERIPVNLSIVHIDTSGGAPAQLMPVGPTAGILEIIYHHPFRCWLTFHEHNSGRIWVGNYNGARSIGSRFSGWVQLATAEPLIEHNLPLASGLAPNGAKYWKNQFGEVTIRADVLKSDFGVFSAGDTIIIGTLPVGFRPNVNTFGHGSIRTSSNTSVMKFEPINVAISTDGVIAVRIGALTVAASYQHIDIFANFIAAA